MNIKLLAEKLFIEEDEYKELAELFVESSNEELASLKTAIEAGDAEQTVMPAHSIKGAASSLGLEDIFQTAKTIEEKARNSELSGVGPDFKLLKSQVDDFARLLAST